MSVNKAMLLGKLGKDPELKHLPTGAAVCNFSIATNESWTDKSGTKQERTEWHNIVVYGKLAEVCSVHLSKGRDVFIEGSINTRSWDSDGVKKYMTEINAKNVQFIGSPKEQGAEKIVQINTPAFTADDIPF